MDPMNCTFPLETPKMVRATWFEARRFCRYHGGELFFLKSGEQLDSIANILKIYWPEKKGFIYIGLRHQKWVWNGKFS